VGRGGEGGGWHGSGDVVDSGGGAGGVGGDVVDSGGGAGGCRQWRQESMLGFRVVEGWHRRV
jgi:hypothetical protein